MTVRRLAAHVVLAGLMAATPATANDSIAEIGAGGLVLGRSDVITMESETLFLSMDEVRVDYVFRNNADRDIETVVAFPMPDIDTDPFGGDWAIPKAEDNFLGFTVEAGGATITPQLQQRAIALGVDVTDIVTEAGFTIAPLDFRDETLDVAALSQDRLAQLVEWGIVTADRDPESGAYAPPVLPSWKLRTAYWWRMTFPAGEAIEVRHRYAPALGGSAGLFFLTGEADRAVDPWYASRYCIDQSFLNAAVKRQQAATAQQGTGYTEARLSYILSTGGNWAGPIGTFRLVVDKGSTDNLVSFCAEGVTKTGPTTFEVEKTDFWPEGELDILFVVAHGQP